MRLHYKVQENETIQYVDIMSLYPYICKYFKFPVGHPRIHVGDACKDMVASLRMEGLILIQSYRHRHCIIRSFRSGAIRISCSVCVGHVSKHHVRGNARIQRMRRRP